MKDRRGVEHKSQKSKFNYSRKHNAPLVYNYPEPFIALQGTRIYAVANENSEITSMVVTDGAGVVVRTLSPVRDGDMYQAQWDGLDDTGQPVAAGTYTVKVTAVHEGKTVEQSVAVEMEGGAR